MEKYQNRITAFVDILGFKKLIKTSESNFSKLTIIQRALKYLKTWDNNGTNKWDIKHIAIEEDAQNKGLQSFSISEQTACTCFSDSIVVSILCEDSLINEKISTLIANLSYIGSLLLQEGILIRGGITIGKLIHTNDGIIMGPALIEAYSLESSCAKNARIILSNNLISILNYPITKKNNRYPYHQYLKRFEDGCVGFHQIQYYEVIQSENIAKSSIKNDLDIIRLKIINGLDMSFSDPDVFLKYKWLEAQYKELTIHNEKAKLPIYDVNHVDNHHNIHFSQIDTFMNKRQLS